MISTFFIKRPVFAWVIAIAIMGAGVLAILSLPVEQYPNIAAPKVTVSATYPGASAQTLEKTVVQVIEQNLTGIDNLRYIQSSSSSSGQATITLTFEPGTDPDIAQVQTQNKVSQAESSLPQVVQRQGLAVQKAGSSYALILGFYSTDESYGRNEISDFLASNLEEPLSRVDGVGQITTFGPQHAMRIWLQPDALYEYQLTTADIVQAVNEQNVQLATGQIGGTPSIDGQQLNATITSQSLLQTVEEFENILLTVNQSGANVVLGDVARIEVGAENYRVIGRYNGQPASGIAIELAPNANALETIKAVKERVTDFEDIIPEALEIAYPVDISPFIEASIIEVFKTLVIAIVLVVLVIYIFLQSARATIIPGIAIPVVILGTFACLYALGYSINVLTLFALVLAIGMLVDDAIVVTENVENKLENDSDLSPKQAAKEAMKEISGALLGTTAVIWAVFIPITFFEGSVGVIYRQFAVTISVAMGISLFIALSLSPTMCARVLQQGKKEKNTGFFGLFNKGFSKLKAGHAFLLEKLLASYIVLPVVFVVLIGVAISVFLKIPSAFLPDEDQGRMFTLITGPASSTLQQTLEKNAQVEDFYLNQTNGAVEGLFTAAGFSFAGNSQNVGIAFIKMADWSKRGEGKSVFEISDKASASLSRIQDAFIIPIVPPAISALGNASGFEFQLVDRANLGQEKLNQAKDQLLQLANQNDGLTRVRFNGLAPGPQYDFNIDASKARAMGVSLDTINQTLSTALGGSYINDYLGDGRIKRVYAQADAPYRMLPEDIDRWYVRNMSGEMVSISEFGSGEWTFGAPKLTRFNGSSSLEIQGEAASGVSSGEALNTIASLAQQLPEGIAVEWTGLSFEEKESAGQAWIVYLISVIAVFLALAALYESWSIPLAIMLTVPLGIFGAVMTTFSFNQANDVYFQIGLLMTIALAAKNAILIIEFAKTNFENGMSAYDASVKAAKQRIRPILMTSLTFILGVMPLAFASGPGSGAQNAISIGVLGGITSATIFVLFFAPYFFILSMKLFSNKAKN
uniref:efflux RND transporter permease subunit n=1 Tax=Ningiella ruwaisensis TaxID=2364274 RepID=UPI00109F84DC|nr:efflux RND transporter permease subunit [Ningiella ruwaisensis]